DEGPETDGGDRLPPGHRLIPDHATGPLGGRQEPSGDAHTYSGDDDRPRREQTNRAEDFTEDDGGAPGQHRFRQARRHPAPPVAEPPPPTDGWRDQGEREHHEPQPSQRVTSDAHWQPAAARPSDRTR